MLLHCGIKYDIGVDFELAGFWFMSFYSFSWGYGSGSQGSEFDPAC